MSKAKLFICHHPGSLLLYKNLAKIIKKYDQESKIILFKINHPYFVKFNFNPYEKYFDEIKEFDFINYKKNFLLGYWQIFKFKKKLKKIENNLLANFKEIDLFLGGSAWLPINILLYNLKRNKNIKGISRLTTGKLENSQTKTDKIKTFLCAFYSLPFKCYKVKVISTLEGKFMDFAYNNNVPGTVVKIANPMIEFSGSKNILPYPIIIPDSSKSKKKDMVVIFGDASIAQFYSEYLPKKEILVEKLSAFFKTLENKYSESKLYYKPHPDDKNQLMPGIDPKKYNLFNNSINAQMIFYKYSQRIKAVYTFSSTSVVTGSFFGIPSYTFYCLLSNPAGIEKFNNLFEQDNIKSKFLFHISDLKEIGKIDNLERPKPFDLNKVVDKYKKILNI